MMYSESNPPRLENPEMEQLRIEIRDRAQGFLVDFYATLCDAYDQKFKKSHNIADITKSASYGALATYYNDAELGDGTALLVQRMANIEREHGIPYEHVVDILKVILGEEFDGS